MGKGRSILLCCLAALSLSAGCRTGAAPVSDTVRFPTGEKLCEGDIILGRSYGIVGAVFARFGSVRGRYSHAALYYHGEAGNGKIINFRPFGMEACDPADYFSRYNRLALIRYHKNLPAEVISRSARKWLETDKRKRFEPDYELDRKNHTRLFCLELVSAIFTENNLSDPFARTSRVEENPVISRILGDFNLEVEEISSPNSILEAQEFRRVADWLKPDYDLRLEVLNNTIVDSVAGYLEEGMEVRPIRFGGWVKIRLFMLAYRARRLLMPWKRKASIPEFVGSKSLNVGYMLYQHVSLTKKRARKQFATELPAKWEKKDVMRISRQVSDSYRDRFFVMPPASR